jgi:hypothetical protein
MRSGSWHENAKPATAFVRYACLVHSVTAADAFPANSVDVAALTTLTEDAGAGRHLRIHFGETGARWRVSLTQQNRRPPATLANAATNNRQYPVRVAATV